MLEKDDYSVKQHKTPKMKVVCQGSLGLHQEQCEACENEVCYLDAVEMIATYDKMKEYRGRLLWEKIHGKINSSEKEIEWREIKEINNNIYDIYNKYIKYII